MDISSSSRDIMDTVDLDLTMPFYIVSSCFGYVLEDRWQWIFSCANLDNGSFSHFLTLKSLGIMFKKSPRERDFLPVSGSAVDRMRTHVVHSCRIQQLVCHIFCTFHSLPDLCSSIGYVIFCEDLGIQNQDYPEVK
ncbi:hypothetical protein CEXT_319441 [Caerostris extrusa]|uniref:Uncharacterized protein n=1 Tax=Caerostris extrusa TaxID=172846 RepID=A0AAV4UW99_CAEEX|nr:hypothetical protein CEXT_319441 [Caerostris extrusa]